MRPPYSPTDRVLSRGVRSFSLDRLARLLPVLALGCGPSPDDPLPPKDDLYAYSLAVAEKTRLKVPAEAALAIFNVGQVHERFGFEDKALEYYWTAVDRDADLGSAYRRIGFLLSQRKNQLTEAGHAYEQALRCDADFPGVYTRLGLIFLHQDRPEEAASVFREEIRAKIASADTYYHLGQAESAAGKSTEAIQALRKALDSDPDMRSAHYALARELRIAGEEAAAAKALAKFRELKAAEDAAASQTEPRKDNRAAQRRFAGQTWLDAADLYYRAASTPSQDDTREEKSRTQERLKTFRKETVAALEEAVRLAASLTEAWNMYVVVLRNQNRLPAALSVSERARSALPDDGTWPYRSALLHLQLAQEGDEARRRYAAAVKLLEEATRKAPDYAKAHFQFARTVLFNIKKKTQELILSAVKHGEKAVALEAEPAHYDVLAYGYSLVNRLDLARKTLEEGLRKNPDAPALKHRLQLLEKKLDGQR